eukprot:TRINITY_DN142_c0_g1_i1.p2 TRINITY_DN142_c0_g1~~TRINITY_DN142_c0_g1_i1.p2  ORF type:complete len:198 (+),score=41.38 TRINITY_DN142_c0_g1_i1:192-785(+)
MRATLTVLALCTVAICQAGKLSDLPQMVWVEDTAPADMTCPGSPAHFTHAGMKLTATTTATCAQVQDEASARVAGQYGTWHDPHNNGTYFPESLGGTISFSRATASSSGGSQPFPGKYTDKMIFTLTDQGSGCQIEACSESQVTSVGDFGTNYCNLKMLFCGSADGCHPVKNDFTVTGETTTKMASASVSLSGCLKK